MVLLTVLFLYSVSLFAQSPGAIQTIAGAASASFSGDGGPANLATLNVAVDVAADLAGNLLIADQFNHRIRKIAPDGTIATVVGTGAPGYSGDGGPAVNAQINTPTGICADAAGNLYIADVGNQRIRKVDASGIITTLAGNGSKGYGGDGGPATSASFYNAVRVVVDPSGNVLVADQSNHRLRAIAPDGTISTIAGTGVGTPANGSFSGDGGPATSAALNNPTALTVDANGVVYFADQFNHRIRMITPDGTITTIAGTGSPAFAGDGGPAIAASLNYPGGITVDSAGNVYFNDDLNYRTRRIAADGTISTIAGSGAPGFSGDGGPATAASLNGNFGIAIDAQGNLYIADSTNNRIREVYAVAPGTTTGSSTGSSRE
jgi:sugar lactone lactonase YvrE